VLAPAAAADAKERIVAPNVPFRSSNVRPLLTLPVPHPIGARFRDGFMYVTTTEGLTVYDISRPRRPIPVGALPLPHFENEDVDLGGSILLISNDPSEGVGVLYVIDISDPTRPLLKAAMPNGFIETGIPGEVGLNEPVREGIGHTASCIQRCRFAPGGRTGLTRASRYSFVCRLPTASGLRKPSPPLPGVDPSLPPVTLPALPSS
jgi:hypothetical protein